jgi:hypothetical protein
VFADCVHQQIRIDLIEEALDNEIQNPRVAPTSLPRYADRIECRLAGLRITTKAPGYNGIMAPGIPE